MHRHFTITIAVAVVIVIVALYLGFKQPVLAPVGPDVVTDDGDRIKVSYPLANTSISSPLIVKGEARGTWYFEASFPIVVVDWDGLIIGEGHAEAKSDWMTEDYVPFEGTITFTKPICKATYCVRGAVILQKDNPSGLPEYDAAIEIPIVFE